MAVTNQLTVIEGPPGTGKTQTILNIIANILIQGKTVAVVSNNNSATLNVYEKLKKNDLEYLCAFLGNRKNKNAFIEQQEERKFEAPAMTGEAWEQSLEEADEAQKALSRFLALQNEKARLETEARDLELERKHYYQYVNESFGEKELGKIPLNLTSTQVLVLKVSLEEYAEKYGREALSWIRKLWLYIGFHIRNRMFLNSEIEEKDIGIISPYRDQANAAGMEVSGQLAVDTVHKFQGREKDAVIITTVDNEITEYADNPNLLNVAVSRAVSKLRLVISGNEQNENTNIGALVNYIAYEKGEVIQGTVFSVFDLLYSQYREVREAYLKNKRRVSQVESENLLYYFLQELFIQKNLQDLAAAVNVPLRMIIKDKTKLDETEREFVQSTGSHADFLIYRKEDKKILLAIEVDGAAYHKNGSVQKEIRDKKKDRIFDKCGLPLLRLSTTGSGEGERIIAALQDQNKYKNN